MLGGVRGTIRLKISRSLDSKNIAPIECRRKKRDLSECAFLGISEGHIYLFHPDLWMVEGSAGIKHSIAINDSELFCAHVSNSLLLGFLDSIRAQQNHSKP